MDERVRQTINWYEWLTIHRRYRQVDFILFVGLGSRTEFMIYDTGD